MGVGAAAVPAALTATVVGSKVYVLGGLGADGKPTDIFDAETKKWATGPALPGEGKKAMAFSPSAATVGGRVVVNTAAGPVYRLTADGGAEKVGAAATPRMVARMIPLTPASVLLVGGASPGEGNVAAIETVKLAEKGEPVAPAKQP